MSDAPHRQAPITVTLEEYQALAAERNALADKLDAAEKANSRRARWASSFQSLMVWIVMLACAAGLCWSFWWLALRDRASGARGRHNAEVEAVKYITATRGAAPISVICVDTLTGRGEFNLLCIPNPSLHGNLHCDSDEPSRNDGCVE